MSYRSKLGELLVRRGYISEAQLQDALREQARTGERLGQVLLRRGYLKEEDLVRALATQQQAEVVQLGQVEPDPQAVALVDDRFARKHRVFPYRLDGHRLYVAMANPGDLKLIDELRYMTGREIVPQLASDSEILHALNRALGRATIEEVRAAAPAVQEDALPEADASPAVRMADALLRDAIAAGASDLHLDPSENALVVRMRVDGVLQELRRIVKEEAQAIVARFKILAGLDIAERRRPQDGHFSFVHEGKRHEVRIASVGTLWGEQVVLRIIYPTAVRIGLEQLGMFRPELEKFSKLVRSPHGILFVTGPTGSGKTTTLYAALEHIYTPERNFITIEDPVEFPLEGINQIPVQPRIGLGFAEVLRAALRLDPDVILVGEVRDAETLDTALRAALTGHFVLATLHANDALSAVSRLIEMGAERYLLASTLRGIVAQRLVRRVCPQCGDWRPLTEEERWFLSGEAPPKERRGEGCSYCRNTGYTGRVGLYEVFAFDRESLRIVGEGEGEPALRAYAEKIEHRTLREIGLLQVREGQTTVEELMRVLGMLEA
ncbi:GspE/PulE family protein [Oceanithermus desulfurans]|uniref:Type II secretion system protein E n=2 Tax=Oceanithermus desulfurans TaxID=227924 RepID=A0A511RL43_9DEIN|nr:GspE/PulE family protein [Oceanithermus desulfurans]MBB6029968.1 general secretion pathway protein E/type IV pilus assembly protein PilB [Oceanithermus desulfurans]GEM90383.1 type II secretion system protein E [Oceanithermus desulfurans NBRC 100063]